MRPLSSGIAHDFNNVLFAILGYSELLRASMLKSVEVRLHLDETAPRYALSATRKVSLRHR